MMRLKERVTAVLAILTLLGTSCEAFYMKLGGGIAFARDLHIQEVDGPVGNREVSDIIVSFKPSPRINLAFGQQIFDIVRLEAEAFLMAYPIQNITTTTSFPDTLAPSIFASGQNEENYFLSGGGMLNAIYEQKVVPMLSVYAGGGIGVALGLFDIDIEDVDNVGLKPHLASQAMVGLSFCPLSCVSVNLGYKALLENRFGNGLYELKSYPFAHIVEASVGIGF